MRRFLPGIIGLHEAGLWNVLGRSDMDKKRTVPEAWHCSTAKRAKPWVEGVGDSRR